MSRSLLTKTLLALMPLAVVSVPTTVFAQWPRVLPCAGNADPDCVSLPGPLGIGSVNPPIGTKLEIQGGFVQITRLAGGTGTAGVWFDQQNVPTLLGRWALGSRNAGHFVFYNAGSNRDVMYLLPNGNVGIGIQNPNQALTVSGMVSSTAGFYSDGGFANIGGPILVRNREVITGNGDWDGGAIAAYGNVWAAGDVDTNGVFKTRGFTVINNGEWVGGGIKAGGSVEVGNVGVIKVGGRTVIDASGNWVGPGAPGDPGDPPPTPVLNCTDYSRWMSIPQAFPSGTFELIASCPAGRMTGGGHSVQSMAGVAQITSMPDSPSNRRKLLVFINSGYQEHLLGCSVTCCTLTTPNYVSAATAETADSAETEVEAYFTPGNAPLRPGETSPERAPIDPGAGVSFGSGAPPAQ